MGLGRISKMPGNAKTIPYIYIHGTFEHQKCRRIDVKYQLPRRKNENKLKKNLTQPLSFLSERPRGQAVSYSQRNPLSLAAFNPTEGINR